MSRCPSKLSYFEFSPALTVLTTGSVRCLVRSYGFKAIAVYRLTTLSFLLDIEVRGSRPSSEIYQSALPT